MPTLEVQLAKAQKDMDALVDSGVTGIAPGKLHYYSTMNAEITRRIRYLQQRLAVRNERAELRAAAAALMLLREQRVELPLHVTHTSEPTAPA